MKISKRNSVQCKSINEYLNIVLNGVPTKDYSRLFYRGESKYHKYIVPSLYLNEKLAKKQSEVYYRDLFSQLGIEPNRNGYELFKQISELQHYGAKTRILDVTSNPLVALYFAVEKHFDVEKKEPGYVYLYGSYFYNEEYDTSKIVGIKAAMNMMSQRDIDGFFDACEYFKNFYIDETDEEYWEHQIVPLNRRKLYKTIGGRDEEECRAHLIRYFMLRLFWTAFKAVTDTSEMQYQPFVLWEDITTPHFVIPTKCTDRIKQQQGAFIFPGYVNTDNGSKRLEKIQEEIDESISELSAKLMIPGRKTPIDVIVIPAEYKKKIHEELMKLGFTEGFIYPEIEHFSNSIIENL